MTNVINGLVEIIQTNYIGQLLTDEQKKLAVRYDDFAKNQHADSEVKLMLDDRWNADEQALLAKRASAQSLIAALQSVSTGFSELAANSRKLEAKELPGLLEPYVQQIQSLIPQI